MEREKGDGRVGAAPGGEVVGDCQADGVLGVENGQPAAYDVEIGKPVAPSRQIEPRHRLNANRDLMNNRPLHTTVATSTAHASGPTTTATASLSSSLTPTPSPSNDLTTGCVAYALSGTSATSTASSPSGASTATTPSGALGTSAANIGKGTIYLSCGTKDDLIRTLVIQKLSESARTFRE
ncbi:hypothetical protein ABZ912_00820 [Nonomuraea angiospora]|uniref:hypothetical protein n=1 Tax=Nonomuraea angiospora TaxID=46172 RepID=UPI0033F5BA40